jgi:hypothetical protein
LWRWLVLQCLVFGIKHLGDVAFEFLLFGLDELDGEGYDSSADLDGHGVGGFKSKFVFQQNDRTKLRSIIFNIEAIRLALDDGMTSAYTNIVDSHL